MNDTNLTIKCRTEGFEEATQEIETLAEAYDGFPAQVVIKNCHDCTINIYPSQTKFVEKAQEEAYQRGLNDAWDAARKIGSNSMCSLEEMGFDFSQCVFNDYNPSWYVVKNYSASEAIEKIRAYEQEKEKQIQVGDEVINRDKKAVVTEITDRFVRIMYSDGSGYALFSENMTKTGRNFPEIAAVLEKMRETNNG